MQPLLENKVDYFQKKISLGKRAVARLYNDRIEIVDTSGSSLANIPLKDVTSVHYIKGGQLKVYVGDQMHGLAFVTMAYRLFGLIGWWLSHGMKKAQAWEAQLKQLGFNVEKKFI